MAWNRCGMGVNDIDYNNCDNYIYSAKNSNTKTSYVLTTSKKYKLIILTCNTFTSNYTGGSYSVSITGIEPIFNNDTKATAQDASDPINSTTLYNKIIIYKDVPLGTSINIGVARGFVNASCFYE